MKPVRKLAFAIAGVAALTLSAPSIAQTGAEMIGNWHGNLATPQGEVTLVLYITESEDGALKAQVENAFQAPGQMADVDAISVEDGHLSWKIDRIDARFEGDWDPAAQRWMGTFNQGVKMPLAFERGLPPPFPVIEGMDGRWEGIAELNGAKLKQVLRIDTSERGTIVLYDSPDQMAMGMPVRDLEIDGRNVAFSLMNGISRFQGMLDESRSALTGQFTTTINDNVATAALKRGDAAERQPPKRPQNPQEPFPYEVEEVSFANPHWPDVHLAGTLTLPEGDGPFPAAVMITGSGGQDRDEALMGHRPFAVIADYLTRRGIAVLRFDDRGIGASTGAYDTATSADLATDANAAFAFLHGHGKIDPDAIGFIGHSEGGMIAPIAMAGNPDVAFAVLLAGPGTNLEHLLLSQQRLVGASMGASQEQIDRQEPIMRSMFRAIAAAETPDAGRDAAEAILTPEALTALGVPPDFNKDAIVGRVTGPWFQYFLKYDPAPNLSRIRVPLLTLNGSLDLQVPADDNLAAIAAATGDNPDVTTAKLDGLNHLFQHATTGGIGEYAQIEETFAPEALEMIGNWIAVRFLPE